jgi:hypothetical protein
MLGKAAVAGLVVFAVLQVARPGIPTKAATEEVQASAEVKNVLDKDCYSCHSDERRLSWFDQIVSGYWLVRHDILTAREHLNFSTLGSKPAAAQKAALYEAVNMIQLGATPLPSFLKLHPESEVAPAELASLKAYLAPWSTAPGQPPGAYSGADPNRVAPPVSLSTNRRLSTAGFTGNSFCEICGKRDWPRRSEWSKSGMRDLTVPVCFCQALLPFRWLFGCEGLRPLSRRRFRDYGWLREAARR